MKVTQSRPDSATPWIYSTWYSPGQNTGVGSLSLLQGIFPTQGSNPGLPHCRQTLYQLSHTGNKRKQRVTFHGTQLAYQSPITVRQVIFTQKPTVCYKLVMKIISHLLQKMFTYFFPYSVFPLLFSPSLSLSAHQPFPFPLLLSSYIQINHQSQPSTTQQEVAGNLQGCNFTR